MLRTTSPLHISLPLSDDPTTPLEKILPKSPSPPRPPAPVAARHASPSVLVMHLPDMSPVVAVGCASAHHVDTMCAPGIPRPLWMLDVERWTLDVDSSMFATSLPRSSFITHHSSFLPL